MALSDNLQGWWCPSLDTSGNGTTTLTDLSSNGNNGTLIHMDAATDWVADTDSGGVRALEYDGSVQFVEIPDVEAISGFAGSYSLVTWVQFSGTPDNMQIAFKGHNSNNEIEYSLIYFKSTNRLRFYTASGSPLDFVEAATFGAVETGVWYCVVGVFNSNTGKSTIYVNGLGDTSSAAVPSGNDRPESLGIGCATGGSRKPLSGRIDGVAIYDRALTADEVTQLYNGGRSFNLLSTDATIVPQLLLRRRRMSGGLVI